MSDGPARRLVVGVGNPDAGDDAAGRLVARRLRSRRDQGQGEEMVVRECSGEPTELMAAWEGFDDVVLVDACSGGGAPGRILRFEAPQLDELDALQSRQRSTHGFGVTMAVALARALGVAPKALVVYAVEGRSFQAGAQVSPEVERAADDLVGLLSTPGRPAASTARPGT
ncbi:MAG TPA: hydrogenase maturation protease [Vicinamibacteria bacterium]|nr:hydrogenase maturation protease [Vicinamibacteria bacterium]